MGLVCIKNARESYAAGISLVAWRLLKLKFEVLPLLWKASRYEGYECAVGEIGVEGWVEAWNCLCYLAC